MYDTSTQTWSAPYEIAIGQTSTTTRLPFPCDRVAIYMGSVPTTGSKNITLSGFRFGRAIELAKVGNYQDRIYKNDGKWYIEKNVVKVVLDGSETGWQTNYDSGLRQFFLAIPDVDVGDIRLSSKCNRFIYNAATGFDNVFFVAGNKLLVFRNPKINNVLVATTVQEWKTWLASNPTTVYYALATPTTTEITDETLRAQLNFLASLYEGENNISLVGTGAQGEMEVFIRDVMSVETDVVPEVPVRLTLTDDGVINACGCRRNVQLTMRETVQ
jgi:hypothetical protein